MDHLDQAGLTPLAGGWSGQTFLADAGGDRSVVRLYPPRRRDDAAPEVDAAVLRLVRGLVRVPEVLEVRRGDVRFNRPGLLVTSFVEGERGDLVLPRLDDSGAARLGSALGAVAGDLAGMPTLTAGPFVDGDLAIGTFGADDGLPVFVEERAAEIAWDAGLLDRLLDVAVRAQAVLDAAGRTCLVHSDLNPKNVLVDPETLQLTAVLDWEFAHSGHPFTDLGNLLRFDRSPAYVAAVLAAYGDKRGVVPADALETARAADLWALVDLAARHGANPVADRAAAQLRAIAETGDLHATA